MSIKSIYMRRCIFYIFWFIEQNFMVAAALCMAVGAQAQEQANLASEKQNDNTELKVRFDNLTALLIDEKSTDVFNAFFRKPPLKLKIRPVTKHAWIL